MNAIDADTALGFFASLAGIAVLMLYRGHDSRLSTLERNVESKESARAQRDGFAKDLAEHAKRDEEQNLAVRLDLKEFRAEAREQFLRSADEATLKRREAQHELKGFKSEIGGKVEVMRIEINAKVDKIYDQIGALANTYAQAAKK